MPRLKGFVDPGSKRSAGNLAWLLRQEVHEKLILKWFMLIMMGKNPKFIEDDRCTNTNGMNVIPDEDDARVPSPERRDAAMREMLNRRDGLPMQAVQLTAELKTFHAQFSGEISAGDLAALPPEALGRVVGALRGVIAGARALPAGRDEDELLDGKDEDQDAAVIVAGPPHDAKVA